MHRRRYFIFSSRMNNKKKMGRPKVEENNKRVLAGWTFPNHLIEKVKSLATLTGASSSTSVAEQFILDGIAKYEKKNGVIPIHSEEKD